MLPMRIRVGFEFTYEFVASTPMVLMLNVHPSRATDLIKPDQLRTTPTLPMTRYADAFGNICTRLTAPKGRPLHRCGRRRLRPARRGRADGASA